MELKLNIGYNQVVELVNQLPPAELENLLAYILCDLKSKKQMAQKTQPIQEVKKKRQYGFAKGMILYVAPDFDETPPGFEEYMPAAK